MADALLRPLGARTIIVTGAAQWATPGRPRSPRGRSRWRGPSPGGCERFPHIRDEQLERTYSPRLGAQDDVAAAVAYLIGDEAPYVNGSDLRIDGDRTGGI